MKLVVLHLSDIHFRVSNNLVSKRLPQIVAALRSLEHKYDTCIILVSGDITFSGKESEYQIALDFFSTLKKDIEQLQPGLKVRYAFVPGNHDCDFAKMPADVHEAVLNNIPSKLPELKATDGLVTELLSLQDGFFAFEAELTNSSSGVPAEERLHYHKIFTIEGTHVQVNCYNTSWMSRIKEVQGKILFPLQLVSTEDLGTRGNQLVISMFHHPYGWFEANNSLSFERLIDHSSDVVLTGHEHVEKYSRMVGITGEEVSYSKGSVLQQEGAEGTSGFNLVYIDLEERKQKVIQYKWKTDKYSRAAQTELFDFIRNKSLKGGLFEVSEEWSNELEDAGAGFDHPRKDTVTLRDIFVYPDLRDRTFEINQQGKEVKQKRIKGGEIVNYVKRHPRVLIIGADLSGRSTLAKVLASELKDLVPVLMSGQDLDGPDLAQFMRSVSRVFSREYSRHSLETFQQLDKNRRALIIDDFHRSKFKNKVSQNQIIELACQEFGTVVIFADEIFQIQGLAAQSRPSDPLRHFRNLSIKELGYQLRAQLIKKWVTLGQESTFDEKELVLTVSNYAKVILNTLGKNILPSHPLIILTIVQAWEASQSHDMQAGSYGHIYEELITRALRKVSDDPEEVDTKYTYIARLAYYAFDRKQKSLSPLEIREVYKEYVRLYSMSFSLERMLHELEAARILRIVDGNYQFKYKYVYYYFVARYFKETMAVPEESDPLRRRLFEMADRVHNEEYANILAFYVYRTKDLGIIERLVANAKQIFDDYPPCDFDGQVGFLNKIYTSLPKLELPASDAEKNQDQHWQKLDETEEDSADLPSAEDPSYENVPYSSGLSVFLKMNMALKSLQVIGQILRNSPGSMRANIKFNITKEGYELGLRLLAATLDLARTNLDGLREYYGRLIGEKRDIKSEAELLRLADGILIDLTQSIAFGVVKAVSHALGHEKLTEIYAQVLKQGNDNSATKLIDLSIKLDHFRAAPEVEIAELQKRFHKNNFAYAVLRDLVANYLYLFPVDESTRQRLGQTFDLRTTDPKMLVSRDKKLLPT